MKTRVKKSEDARTAYECQNQIWSLDDKQNITSQRLADVNKELTDAQSERMRKESLYQFAKSGYLDAVPQVQSNTTLMELLRKHGDLTNQFNDALSQYGPNFPKVVRLQAQVKELDASIDNEIQKIVDILASDFRERRDR